MRAVIDLDVTYETKFGYTFKILEYKSAKEVVIKFLDKFGAELVVETVQIKRGTIVNPYQPTVFGVGYIGQGEYKPKKFGVATKAYTHWVSMLDRCYGKLKTGNYLNCSVSEEFLNFQVFASWITKQIGFDAGLWALDKDIVKKGNTEYNRDVCVLVPQSINNFTNMRKGLRGDLPIGVSRRKTNGKYVSQGNFDGFRSKYIGTFDTPYEAFIAYKKCKEAHAKFLAKEFSGVLDPRVIKALTEYEVNIND